MNGNNFPPNINPQLYSILAVVVGAALIDDYSTNELNSIGQWIVLVGHFVVTTSAQQRLIEGRIDGNNININSKQAKSGGSFYTNGRSNQNTRGDVDYLLGALRKICDELEKIKNED